MPPTRRNPSSGGAHESQSTEGGTTSKNEGVSEQMCLGFLNSNAITQLEQLENRPQKSLGVTVRCSLTPLVFDLVPP